MPSWSTESDLYPIKRTTKYTLKWWRGCHSTNDKSLLWTI